MYRLSHRSRLIVGIGVLAFLLFLSLMGEQNRRIAGSDAVAVSGLLAGKVIVIDPGHGGHDPGTVGVSGVKEKDITLQIARKVAVALRSGGAKVIMTRDGDYALGSDKAGDLTVRVQRANNSNADLFISIHANSYRSDPRQRGAQVFSQPGAVQSRQLALAIQAELVQQLGNTHRQALQADYFVGRETKMPAVIVEVGFLTNPEEEKLLLSAGYQDRIAFAIVGGIIKYLEGREGRANQKT